jgi:DNA invertase Pin-like site-specific DNA recombinase
VRLSSGQPWGQPSQDEIARVLHELAAGDTINVRWMDRLARSVADLTHLQADMQ